MIQFAWRFLRFQRDSGLAQWFAARTTDGRGSTRKTMIVALARKLLIALSRLFPLRSGLSRSDLVLWPVADAGVAGPSVRNSRKLRHQ
jgi:transposase